MEGIDRWLATQADNPLVQLLCFVLIFVLRLEVDRRQRRAARAKQDRRKAHGHG